MKNAANYEALTNVEAVGRRWRFVAWGVEYTGHAGGNIFSKEAFLILGRVRLAWYLGEVDR